MHVFRPRLRDACSRRDARRARRAGALWALTHEPGAAHEVARSRDRAVLFFEDMLAARVAPDGLKPLNEKAGFVGDPKAMTIRPVGEKALTSPTAWLPDERMARAWQAMVSGKPLEPSLRVRLSASSRRRCS